MDFLGMRGSIPKVGGPKKVCAVCQIPSGKSCSACHKVFYCSTEHQRSHWKIHKKDCPAMRIVSSPDLGPHFVATYDIPAGTLLLTELPVLIIPLIKSEDLPGLICCISCRSIIRGDPWTCSQCSTPFFCNLACSMEKVHSEFECGFLSKCSVEQRNKLCLTTNLGYLRAIHLKNSDSKTWAKVLKLRGANHYKPEDDIVTEQWFNREILPLLGEKGAGFEEDMAKLLGIIQNRALAVYPNGNSEYGHGGACLFYLEANNFAHNCFPNCIKIIGKGPQFQLKIRTSVEVKKGSILSIDYMGKSNGVGAMIRQHQILTDGIRGDLCICPRCSDPTGTELGTMHSAVKCTHPNCKDGYLLPVNVRDMAMDAPWRCNRAGCKGKGSTWTEIEKLTNTIDLEVETFRERVPLEDFERTCEFLESLKKKLHPNHNLVLRFETNLVPDLLSILKSERMESSLQWIDLKISILEHLLRMMEIMDPGLSLSRAYYLNMLSAGYVLKLSEIQTQQGYVEKELIERTTTALDTFLSIRKYYPIILSPSSFQTVTEGLGQLQLGLDSTSSTIRFVS